ncbi:MAG TPA: multicopper oxidase family protein [Gemmatimonadales bacterium]
MISLLMVSATLAAASVGPCDAWNPVHGDPGLHCIELVPRPEYEGATGSVRLVHARSPFGLAVTRDGVPLLDLVVRLEGLPAGEYTAWASGPLLEPIVPLGPVRNGETELGPIALERFTIFVTRGTAADTADGMLTAIALRGMSPSSVLKPHLTVPAREVRHAHGDGWEMPAPHPAAPIMTPGLEVLLPDVTPWLPGRSMALDSLPPVRPRTLTRLASGDTLHLEAGLVRRSIAGRTFAAYAFNGQSPGPLLEVERGARVTIVLVNRLDQPTTVHWHGIRLDHRFDGAAGVSQEPVPPGGSFTYELVFPDAGIYWYHPHVREDVQQELGLYGNILVRGDERSRLGRVHREEVLILDDILLGADGPIAFGEEHTSHALMGRFGNVFLVNGEPRWEARARRGEVVRLYLTNAANARTFNLAIDGARMKLVAGDMGRVAEERWVESVVIGPAERWVVDVRFERAGKYALTNRVRGVEPRARAFVRVVDTLGMVAVGNERATPDLGATFGSLRAHADLMKEFAALDSLDGKSPDRTLVLGLRTGALPFGLVQALRIDTAWVAPVEWAGLMPMMDWLATGRDVTWVLRDSATGRENMAVDWRFRRGDRILLRLVNERRSLHPMHHPIHLHGQRFAVVARNGRKVRDHVWKDTVIVPAGSTVDLLVEFDNPGRWMMHCHVAEHLETGMHLVLEVE